MSLKAKVKVGNITNLSDARYCAGMGVDWLGFPATLDTKLYQEITGWVTGPAFVLEVTDQPSQIANSFAGEIVQLPWTRLGDFGQWKKLLVVVKASEIIEALPELIKFKNKIDHVIVSNLPENSSALQSLKDLGEHFQILADMETSSLLLDSLLVLPISGITVAGSQELKPGLHDYSKLSEVLEQLEVD